MSDLALSGTSTNLVFAVSCGAALVLLFLSVIFLASARRRLGYLEAQLIEIGADLRTISLRIALNPPRDKRIGGHGASASPKPEVSPVEGPGHLMAQPSPSVQRQVSSAANRPEQRRERYIHDDDEAQGLPLNRSSPKLGPDPSEMSPRLTAEDLMKPTHFEPPESAVPPAMTPNIERTLSPEEEGDIWRLRAVRKSVRGVERLQHEASAGDEALRQEPTLRWPPKMRQD